jgi:hypothetical protein
LGARVLVVAINGFAFAYAHSAPVVEGARVLVVARKRVEQVHAVSCNPVAKIISARVFVVAIFISSGDTHAIPACSTKSAFVHKGARGVLRAKLQRHIVTSIRCVRNIAFIPCARIFVIAVLWQKGAPHAKVFHRIDTAQVRQTHRPYAIAVWVGRKTPLRAQIAPRRRWAIEN